VIRVLPTFIIEYAIFMLGLSLVRSDKRGTRVSELTYVTSNFCLRVTYNGYNERIVVTNKRTRETVRT
jgi:hypothetical protein